MKFLQFFQDVDGENSSKRLAGTLCIVQSCAMKLVLLFYGLKSETKIEFNKLDSSADVLLYVGASLLGAGLLEYFKKKR